MEIIAKKGVFPLLIFFLFSFSFAFSIEGCPGESIVEEDVPCLLLLPYSGNCSSQTISLYNSTDLLFVAPLSNYTGDQCRSEFNQTQVGTYPFSYSTGDTGSIVLEVSDMIDIFHVLVYAVVGLLGIIFITMMHIFQEDDTTMVYGGLSSAVWLLLAVINLSGFHLIRGVEFIIDLNYYIVALCVILTIYTATASYFFYKQNYRPQEDPYRMRS